MQRSAGGVLFRLLLLAMVSTSLGGCAGGSAAQTDAAAPAWFVRPDVAYSEQAYLTAVAAGPSAQAAEDRAFGNLARIFEADIEAQQQLREDYREVQTGGEVTGSQQDTRLVTRSDVRSNQKLLNAQVLERAAADGTHYALVGMERRETVRIYAEEIRDNRDTVQEYRAAAERTDSPLTRLAFLQRALVLAQVNERLITQRNIVAGGTTPSTSTPPVAGLQTAVREAQSNCPVAVSAETSTVPPSVLDQVKATLQAAGFRVVRGAGDAILQAAVAYRERLALTSREEKFLRWTLSIALTDRTTGQTLQTFTTEQRAGAMSTAALQRRAHNGARTAIKNDFASFLDRTLLNIDS
jgi:hypothetical protein